MSRQIISWADMECLAKGGWNAFYRLITKAGPREMIGRKNEQCFAAKMLLIELDDQIELQPADRKGLTERQWLAKSILQTGTKHFTVLILAVDRPFTYCQEFELNDNLQRELPGGVLEKDESLLDGSVREALEESGISQRDRVLATAPLWGFAANDAGAQFEMYAGQACIVHGKANPPDGVEGIDKSQCLHLPLKSAIDDLETMIRQGYGVEEHALNALNCLDRVMLREYIKARGSHEQTTT